MRPDPTAARRLLDDFADRTGVDGQGPRRRYLWTDAFALCTWVGLGDLRRAGALVHQVHHVLGRHRDDDPRTGWISGLSEELGSRHPTAGGLRIGKPLPERRPDDAAHDDLEWQRDGQYFHYLTRWMHALDALALATDEARLNLWARELAHVAHRVFTVGPPSARRMVWKCSIDLSRVVVPSMGLHDPLDGLVTCAGLRATARRLDVRVGPTLDEAMTDFADLVRGRQLTTDDPLGLGGLLLDAARVARLVPQGEIDEPLLVELLDAAWLGLRRYQLPRPLDEPVEDRLAFRELGLAIGLLGLDAVRDQLEGPGFRRPHDLAARVEVLRGQVGLARRIVETWRDPKNRRSATWSEHRDINDVMLAAALAPQGLVAAEPVPT